MPKMPRLQKGHLRIQGHLSSTCWRRVARSSPSPRPHSNHLEVGSALIQSPLMSLVEAVANVVVGYLLALLTQIVVFPLFGVSVSMTDNLMIGGIFTVVSLARSFLLRRLFEALRIRTTSLECARNP